MPTLTYWHLDVFTDRLFGGNQLAVCLDPPHDLPAGTMQAIAQEMAFAETTFVFPADAAGTDCRVRIFTPRRNCRWPGTRRSGRPSRWPTPAAWPRDSRSRSSAKALAPYAWTCSADGAELREAWMTQPAPVFGPSLDRLETLAAGIGLEPGDLRPNGLPVQEVSCGVPFVIVPVAPGRPSIAPRPSRAR